MIVITTALIKQAREDTGAGMLDVRKALTEVEGDVARAKEIIRAKGTTAAGKRESRKAQESTITSKVVETANGKTGYAVGLNPETDFVAGTPKLVESTKEVLSYAMDAGANSADELLKTEVGDTIVKLAVEEAAALFGEHIKVGQFTKISGEHVEVYARKESAEMPPSIITMIVTDRAGTVVTHETTLQVSAMDAKWLTREDVPADVVRSKHHVATKESLAEGKPEKTVPKVAEGRLNAFFKEIVLLEQPFVKDPSKAVSDLFKEVGSNTIAFTRVKVGKGEEE